VRRSSCSFCAFSKGKERELDEFGDGVELRGKPYLLDLEEVSRRAAEAWARGATEVCMQGGIHPSFTGETYVDLIRAAKAGAPDIHVHAFSPLEVTRGAETYDFEGDLSGSGSSFTDDPEAPDPRRSRVRAFLRTLRDAGLGSLPGTAAEILDDDVRAAMCPDKISAREWLEVVSDAHRVGLPTTSTLMFGHVDADDNWARARHLVALRDQHARSLLARGVGFTEFVPLPFVHFEAPAFRRGEARRGPTLRECLLAHAVARLALAPAGLANVQASWVKMGPELAGRLLEVGCNDLGGTLMNESITRAAGGEPRAGLRASGAFYTNVFHPSPGFNT
jgi:2-iminoacetate synthase ThiH